MDNFILITISLAVDDCQIYVRSVRENADRFNVSSSRFGYNEKSF